MSPVNNILTSTALTRSVCSASTQVLYPVFTNVILCSVRGSYGLTSLDQFLMDILFSRPPYLLRRFTSHLGSRGIASSTIFLILSIVSGWVDWIDCVHFVESGISSLDVQFIRFRACVRFQIHTLQNVVGPEYRQRSKSRLVLQVYLQFRDIVQVRLDTLPSPNTSTVPAVRPSEPFQVPMIALVYISFRISFYVCFRAGLLIVESTEEIEYALHILSKSTSADAKRPISTGLNPNWITPISPAAKYGAPLFSGLRRNLAKLSLCWPMTEVFLHQCTTARSPVGIQPGFYRTR